VTKRYVACFYGQGGIATSFGIYLMARRLQAMGFEAQTYRYRADIDRAARDIDQKTRSGYLISGLGYSLGCSSLSLLQTRRKFELAVFLAESSLAINYPINHANTKHSVLVHGPDFLSDAGIKLGFDERFYTPSLHLWIDFDPGVWKVVEDQFGRLLKLSQ
jgi:hypothetical protein